MFKGIGLDLCEVKRMERLAEDDHFLRRFFTADEIAYVRSRGAHTAESLAGLFAAKEAFSKAMGTGLVFDLREAEIVHGDAGEPMYRFHGATEAKTAGERFWLSISHDGGVAAAVCVRESCET